MDFFSHCTTKEEARTVFKKLCKCFHPDKGGDETLMIELKKQYDNWHPSGHSTSYCSDPGLLHVYERRISEQTGVIFKLREEVDLYRQTASVNESILTAERQGKYRAEDELRQCRKKILELNEQLQDEKDKLHASIRKKDDMTMMDKVRFVFGYE